MTNVVEQMVASGIVEQSQVDLAIGHETDGVSFRRPPDNYASCLDADGLDCTCTPVDVAAIAARCRPEAPGIANRDSPMDTPVDASMRVILASGCGRASKLQWIRRLAQVIITNLKPQATCIISIHRGLQSS